MKRTLSLLFVLVFCITLFVPLQAQAQGVQYGQVFLLRQPVIIDWSSYAPVNGKFRVTMTDLKTKKAQVLNDKELKSSEVNIKWASYYFEKNASYSVRVEVLDKYGFTTKSITDYFHAGTVVVNPPEVPTDKLQFSSSIAFSKPMWSLWNTIYASNPAFAKSNCDSTLTLMFNNFICSNYAKDAFEILRYKYLVGGYKCNLTLEADLFKRMNAFRAKNSKQQLVWSNNLGKVNRLRAVALCDEPVSDRISSDEVGGLFDRSYSRYNLTLPDGLECIAYLKGSTKAADIMKALEADTNFKTAMLSDHHYGAIAVVQTNRLNGKKEKGIAIMGIFSN